MRPFEDIDSLTIERFFQKFVTSKGLRKYRMVVLGVWTVDLKMMLKFLTNEIENDELFEMDRAVVRGSSHRRPRP